MKKVKHPHRKALILQKRRKCKIRRMSLKECDQYSYCGNCPANLSSRVPRVRCYYGC